MDRPPELFGHKIRALRRSRALEKGFASFIHEEAALIIKERLEEVNKDFRSVSLVTGFPHYWSSQFPEAQIRPDDDLLGFEGEFDLMIHALCAHSSNDPVGQFIQMRRALKPDGLMIAVMFGGQTLHELRAAFARAEVDIRNGLTPRVMPMGEIRDLGGLITRAGFALPVADAVEIGVTYPSPLKLLEDLRAMGETNCLSGQERGFMRRDLLFRMCEVYTDTYSEPDGRIRATFELVFLTGWAPSEAQPKPLRPGTAQARLADALGTVENPAGEKPGNN